MKFTAQQLKTIRAALDERGARCSSCRRDPSDESYGVVITPLLLPEYLGCRARADGQIISAGSGALLVGVVCDGCSHVDFFSLEAMGIDIA